MDTSVWLIVIAIVGIFATLFGAIFTAFWKVMQTQFASQSETRQIKEKCFEDDITHLRQSVHDLLNEQIGRRVFDEYKEGNTKLIDVVRKQLEALETTRPTTGELSATSQNLSHALDKAEARLTTLEQRFNIPPGGG